ncbi:hypothetical protein GOP47_0026591 [Adiantum capillus-veneris]|nr:hypothetical protein GOP47_0026591 [Adiantum capillus-veneris]
MEQEEQAQADPSMSENEQEAAKAAGWYMWPVGEKGAAVIMSFVKDRSVDVSNAIRKLSAKIEDLDREVFDKGFDYMTLRTSKPTEPSAEQVPSVADPPLNMKGRIIFFSMSGCEDSRAVRSLLRKKGLPYIEVFFNEAFIGGIDELKAMEASRELDEKLKLVFEQECPAAAPQSPLPGEECDSLTGNKDDRADMAERLKEKVQIKDRLHKIHWFTRCFVGSEAVGILAENENCSREEAVELGRKLVSKFFFHHVLSENNFEDENHLYRFLEHDPVVMTYCFNFEGKLNLCEPKPLKEIEGSFRKVTQAIVDQFVSEDGRHVDFEGISKSAEFKRYLSIVHQLQRINFLGSTREEKLAFFINLYNAMAIHAVMVLGHPDGPLDRRKFFGDFQYLIGGSPYSLSAIENGVLRANQRPPYSLIKAFGPKDNRLKVSLQEQTPLIHFALSCATKSSPALNCYTSANIDAELRFAARSFFREGGILIDTEMRTVMLNQIMNWYSVDFGNSDLEKLKWIIDYLEPTKAEDLLQLMEGEFKIVYEPYDWSPNF